MPPGQAGTRASHCPGSWTLENLLGVGLCTLAPPSAPQEPHAHPPPWRGPSRLPPLPDALAPAPPVSHPGVVRAAVEPLLRQVSGRGLRRWLRPRETRYQPRVTWEAAALCLLPVLGSFPKHPVPLKGTHPLRVPEAVRASRRTPHEPLLHLWELPPPVPCGPPHGPLLATRQLPPGRLP